MQPPCVLIDSFSLGEQTGKLGSQRKFRCERFCQSWLSLSLLHSCSFLCRQHYRWVATESGCTSAERWCSPHSRQSPCKWMESPVNWGPPAFAFPCATRPTWCRRPRGATLCPRLMSTFWHDNFPKVLGQVGNTSSKYKPVHSGELLLCSLCIFLIL